MKNKLYIISILLVGLIFNAYASDTTELDFTNRIDAGKFQFRYNSKFNLKYLDVDRGLSSSYVEGICEDKNGNIWMTSWGGGIMKYDGKNIFIIKSPNGLPSNICKYIYCSTDNHIYFTIDGLLYKIIDNLCVNVSAGTDLKGHNIIKLKQFDDKSFIAITKDSISYIISENSIEPFPHNLNRKNRHIYDCRFKDGKTYLATDGGFFVLNNGEIENHVFESFKIYNIAIKSNSDFVVVTNNGVKHVLGKDTNSILTSYAVGSYEDSQVDKKGVYWIPANKGIIKYDDGNAVYLNDQNGLTGNDVWATFIDSRDNYWVAIRGGGVCRYDNELFRHFDDLDGLTKGSVWAICNDYNNPKKKYLGIKGGGVCIFENGEIKEAVFNSEFKKRSVRSIYHDKNDNLWIGAAGGLFLYNDNGLQDLRGKYTKAFDDIIFSIKEYENGVIWFMGSGGVLCFDGKEYYKPFKNDALNNLSIDEIFIDSKSNRWICTTDSLICVDKKENVINKLISDTIGANVTFNVLEDEKGRYWIGTRKGLFIYNNHVITRISENEGLSNNIIWSSGIDSNKNIWVGTEFGLSKIKYNNADDYTIETFGIEEGFTGNDCTQNGLLIDEDGKFWWGTSKKLTIIDPKLSNTKGRKPQVLLTDIMLHYKSLGLVNIYNKVEEKNSNLIFNHIENYLTFKFTCIDWGAESKLKFQYILKGFGEDWSPISNMNSITYSNLDPHNYELWIKAISNKGIESDIYKLKFNIKPAYYQTLWFKILSVLLIIIIVFISVRYRITSLKKRQEELEITVKERTIEVLEQNEELNQQNEEILAQRDEIEMQKSVLELKSLEVKDSINAAERIQVAFFKSEDREKGLLPNHFAFFMPKDVVSGDFYWSQIIEENGEQYFFLSVVDCTGHGVPGALMSMLGLSLIKEVFKENQYFNKVITPAELLNQLRPKLVRELGQTSEYNAKEGMDMSVVRINKTKNEVLFAGAKNPLYYTDNNKVVVVNGNKQSISFNKSYQEFNDVKIELKPDQMLFLFSDGFADQFGGPKNKKIGYKKFRELLLSNSKLPLEDQSELLKKYITEWMSQAGETQIDDICVIGIIP